MVTTTSANNKVKRSLKLSILDGAAFSAMAGLTQAYVTPFALAMKASTSEIGLLSSIPNLSIALSQLFAPNLAEKAGSRKAFILPAVFAQAIMWVPILLIPFIISGSQISWLIAIYTLCAVLGAIANPVWGSMMADLVPSYLRGRYFSLRGRISVVLILIFSLLAGLILQFFTDNVFVGFGIIFGCAAAARLLSWYFLSGMFEPVIKHAKQDSQNIFKILLHLRSTNLGRFNILVGLLVGATCLSAPFTSVLYLRDFHFSYIYYLITLCTNATANFFFQRFWGRRADKGGNLKAFLVSCIFLPIPPLLLLVSSNIFWVMLEEIVSAFAWSGFMLTSTNFVYDAADSQNRTKHIAVFNFFFYLAICLGAVIGGFLAPKLPFLFESQLRTLILISAIGRIAIFIFMFKSVAEVRQVPKMSISEFFRNRISAKKSE